MQKRILLVEDDPNLGLLLQEYLESKGFETDLATDGAQALNMFVARNYHFCVLDIMLPKKDGFTLAKDIRSKNQEIPFLFLTAKSHSEDILRGFSLGADDYLNKPFNKEELYARIIAILKRYQNNDLTQEHSVLKIGKYTFDFERQILIFADFETKLSTKESALLKVFSQNLNQNITRSYALKMVWGDDSYFNARSMDVYLTKLRKYLIHDSQVQLLNLHGEGFRLQVME
jgi:DNA-binding response OmpR family regulator